MLCKKCGLEFDGNFCPNCGSSANQSTQWHEPQKGNQSRHFAPGWRGTFGKVSLIFAAVLIGISVFLLASPYSKENQNTPPGSDTTQGSSSLRSTSVSASSLPPQSKAPAELDDAPLIYYVALAENFESYKDQYVKFACRVKSILNEKITLDNSAGGGSGTTVITFSDPSQAKQLVEEQYITVVGQVGVSGLGYYYIDNAEVVDFTGNSLKLYGEQKQQYNDSVKEANASEKSEYISKCSSGYISYTDLIRNPDTYKTAYVKLAMTISQKMSGGLFDSSNYYRCYCGDDEFIVRDSRENEVPKLLTDDEIVIYGQYDGTLTITRALTKLEDELPLIDAKYIELP